MALGTKSRSLAGLRDNPVYLVIVVNSQLGKAVAPVDEDTQPSVFNSGDERVEMCEGRRIMEWIKRFLRYMAFEHHRFGRLYLRICKPLNFEYAEYWKSQKLLHSIGEKCALNPGINITDPAYVRIGNNCTLSNCTLLGHDAAVAVLNEAHGTKLDAVGYIDIRDNCFIGIGAIVMPNTTIGPDAIVAAGSVVTKDVAPGTVVGGVPARFICTTADLMERMKKRSESYPWISLIQARKGAYDPAIEPELVRRRVEYFFGSN